MRESKNGDYSFLNQVNLSDTFFEIYFPKSIVSNIEIASFSGNVGEPAMNNHLLNILRWFRLVNPNIFLEIYTNGSVQKPEWWYELGMIIGDNGNVIFAIDGLEDTNHIYRVGVKWDQLINNVKSYISSKAKATWQFIPFKHNEHQVDQAKLIANQMGFNEFNIKLSHRELLNQPQNKVNQVFPPTDVKYQHEGQQLDFAKLDKTEQYLNSLDIKCYAIELGNIYISAEGLVFPCCHTASIVLLDDDFIPAPYHWIKNVKKDFVLDEISLYKNTLDEILSSDTFTKIKKSWDLNMKQGRNPLCAAVCGKCNTDKSLYEGLLKRS
jgi:MoaA/NifB/PqqE/SkfB family radical SAM enzyme